MKWRLFKWKRRPSFAAAYAQALADMERDYPLAQLRADRQRRADEAWARREAVRARNDHDGEYERGMKGLQ